MSLNAVARTAHAHKYTVGKVLGNPVHTLRESLYKGVNHLPTSSDEREVEADVPDGFCRGGCGTELPYGHAKCSPCAQAAVERWRVARQRRISA